MGYDVRIERLDGSEIELEAWLALANSDPAFVAAGDIRFETVQPLFALKDAPEPRSPFYCWGGAVIVTNPDDITIAKMLEIARLFHGQVVGDDGEVYGGELPERQRRSSWLSALFSRVRR